MSAHFFYQGSLDLLLRELVAPLVGGLRARGLLARYFFLRYWQGGPHVRLRLRPVERHLGEDMRKEVWERGQRFFALHPSRDQLTSDLYAERVQGLLSIEPDAERSSLQPNNTVQFTSYRPEHHKYGSGPALEAVERHFEESSELVLGLICREFPHKQRRVLAFALLAAAAACGAPDLARFAERLERVQKGWSAIVGQSAAESARLSRTYDKQGEQLRVVVSGMWRRPWSATGDAVLDAWRGAVDWLWSTLTDLEHRGEFITAGIHSGWGASSEPMATAYAVANCAHMICNRLGISLQEESFLRGLAVCAALDLRNGV